LLSSYNLNMRQAGTYFISYLHKGNAYTLELLKMP